ncbi:hypothetical protein, partial [Leptospira levettii]
MKNSFKKSMVLLFIAMMGFTMINCPGKKKDDTALFLGLAALLNQPEYTVVLTGTLRGADTLPMKDGKVTVSGAYLSGGQTSISDFTTCATAGAPPANGTVDGEFTILFKVSALSGTLTFTPNDAASASNANACSGAVPATTYILDLPASDYTNATGAPGTLAVNLNLDDRTNTNQISLSGNSGYSITVKAIRVFVKGEYPIVNPTVGETVCDGGRLFGSPAIKTGSITGSETWSGGILLQGTVSVESGATITVTPGTAIFGQRGSSLFFKQGAKLVSNGTAADPICWSSAAALGSRFPGDWGGLVVIGTSGASRSSNTEGTTPTGYGGAIGSDVENLNMSYNIIEFAGNEVAPGDELNNLSIYSSKSVLNFVQVHRGLDDGIEAWGGSGTWSNLLATGGLDDDFDLDEAFTGTMTNLIGHKYPSSCGGSFSTDPHGFEMDGTDVTSGSGSSCNSGSLSRCTNPTITNVTLIGAGISGGQGMRLREGFAGTINRAIIYGFGDAAAVSTSTSGTY